MTSKCSCDGVVGETGAMRTADTGDGSVCLRCGRERASVSSADALLAKLAQLARFGLAAEDGPLLESNGKGR